MKGGGRCLWVNMPLAVKYKIWERGVPLRGIREGSLYGGGGARTKERKGVTSC